MFLRPVFRILNMLLILVICGCGNGPPETSTNASHHGTGGLALHVKFLNSAQMEAQGVSNKAHFDCAGINEIAVQVYNAQDILIASNPTPWKCNQDKGTIAHVPAGPYCTVVFMARNEDGEIVHYGQDIVDIFPGQVADAEIVAAPFEVQLHSPAGDTEASSINCAWSCIDDPDDGIQYEFRLSTDSEMKAYTRVVTEHCEVMPQNVAANTVYYEEPLFLEDAGGAYIY